MYNRYIPQRDGSFRRDQIPDKYPVPRSKPPAAKAKPPVQPSCTGGPSTPSEPRPCTEEPPRPAKPRSPAPCPPAPSRPRMEKPDGHALGLLQKLLPHGFDSGDLCVIALLLLMAGDSEEDRSTALLTLALYLAS